MTTHQSYEEPPHHNVVESPLQHAVPHHSLTEIHRPCDDQNICYSPQHVWKIKLVYVIMIVLWSAIVCYFRLYLLKTWPLLLLPLCVFVVGIYNSDSLTVEIEADMFKASYLPVGAIVMIPMLSWISKDYSGDHSQFVAIIVVSLCCTLLTLIDFWVPKKQLSVYKHLRSGLQTVSLSLIIFALVTYFLHRTSKTMP